MSDILAAASLLLTAVAIIYSLWYPEMMAALKIVPQPHKADNRHAYNDVGRTIRTRALPLFFVSVLLAGIFTPDSTRIVRVSLKNVVTNGLASASDYSAVSTSLVTVTVLLALLAAHLALLTVRLIRLWRRLEPN